jgi:hypothetical protein
VRVSKGVEDVRVKRKKQKGDALKLIITGRKNAYLSSLCTHTAHDSEMKL